MLLITAGKSKNYFFIIFAFSTFAFSSGCLSSMVSLNPGYVLELRDEPLKCNKTATYGDEA